MSGPVERATKVMQDEVNSWHVYDTRDLGDAYHESVGEAAVEKVPDILAAALADPDDPDSLARMLYMSFRVSLSRTKARDAWDLITTTERGHWRTAAEELRMMLTGSVAT